MSEDIVVVGDTLLDRDVYGSVARLCPDTPAPVLDEQDGAERPGGAGLAAVLAAAAGRGVTLVTGLAGDEPAARVSALLTTAGVRVLPIAASGATAEKVRLRANGQTLMRLDRGGGSTRYGEPSQAVHEAIAAAGVVLVSDYGRGIARHPTLRAALANTSAPVVWDPHPRGPAPVAGARLATPNEAEVRQLTGGDSNQGDPWWLAVNGGRSLRQRWRAGAVAVTMGERGALVCQAGPTPSVISAPQRVTGDTCGAGDQFAAAAAVAIADGASVPQAVRAAVAAATRYVAGNGVASASVGAGAVSPAGSGAQAAADLVARVRASGGRVVATGGCFDLLHPGHEATLRAARELGDCLVVCLNSDASVARLKGPDRPVRTAADRSRMLAALRWVDAVVTFDEPTPEAVLSWLRPDVWVKGGDYDGDHPLPELEVLRRWDGEAVLVPYLDGHSTTALVAAGLVSGNGRIGGNGIISGDGAGNGDAASNGNGSGNGSLNGAGNGSRNSQRNEGRVAR